MADAKDILGIPKAVVAGGPLAPADKRSSRTPKEAAPKKPEGVSREVYALTGGIPPLMPTLEPSALKKRNISQSKKISWQWLPFTTSARVDNLQLYHWVKTEDGVAPTGDYSFARYNKAVEIIHYTDEEYNKYLMDPSWTRQETDELFDLCEQFDLRFIIIADRISFSRSVEELKNRYYSASKTILLARAATPEDIADHTLVKDTYNMQYEVERKRALGIFLSQSRQQEREDAEVLVEAKRIIEPRLVTKIEDEMELVATLPPSGGVIDQGEKTSQLLARPSSPSTVLPSTLPTSLSTTITVASSVGPRMPRVFLRSAWLAQMIHSTVTGAGARTIKRVDQALEELGVRVKPKVVTQTVCAQHMELRNEVLTLLNLQKQVQWKETEVSVLHDNPYADIPPPTPNTPKKAPRGGDQERISTRTTALGADADSGELRGSGERSGKREHKRKAPARFSITPPSPPHQKRARKLKSNES